MKNKTEKLFQVSKPLELNDAKQGKIRGIHIRHHLVSMRRFRQLFKIWKLKKCVPIVAAEGEWRLVHFGKWG